MINLNSQDKSFNISTQNFFFLSCLNNKDTKLYEILNKKEAVDTWLIFINFPKKAGLSEVLTANINRSVHCCHCSLIPFVFKVLNFSSLIHFFCLIRVAHVFFLYHSLPPLQLIFFFFVFFFVFLD